MKKLLALLGLTALLSGCSAITNLATPQIVQAGSTALTSAGLAAEPAALPGVRAAAAIICADASNTNINPASVVADINQLDPSLNTPTAVIIENGILGLYIGVWDAYGASAVTNSPVLQSYLRAVCSGINAGLPSSYKPLMLATNSPIQIWPIIKSKP